MFNLLQKLYKSKLFLTLETIFLFLLPLIFVIFNPLYYRFRTIYALCFLPYIFFVAMVNKISLGKLGINKKKLFFSLKALFLPSVFSLLSIFLLFTFLPFLFNTAVFQKLRNVFSGNNSTVYILIYYSLLSAPLQELIFRGYVTSRLELVSQNKLFLMLYTSTSFSLIHLPFNNYLVYLGTFLLGLLWEYNFLKHRNVFSLSLSHAIVGGYFVYNIILLLNR